MKNNLRKQAIFKSHSFIRPPTQETIDMASRMKETWNKLADQDLARRIYSLPPKTYTGEALPKEIVHDMKQQPTFKVNAKPGETYPPEICDCDLCVSVRDGLPPEEASDYRWWDRTGNILVVIAFIGIAICVIAQIWK